jgi:hypothetical protein
MGLTSRAKSICPWAGGGNLDKSTPSAATHREQAEKKMPQPTPHAAEIVPRFPGGGFILIEEKRLSVRAVNRRVATRRPTSAKAQKPGVVYVADEKVTRRPRFLHLGVAAKAHIGIAHGQHLRIDGTVRTVATGATFAHGRMFENDGLGLFPMALGAIFVLAPQRQSARWFHNIHTVRVVALDAVHFAFEDEMVLGQMKFRLDVGMALETSSGILAGIKDEVLASAACRHVFAAGAVARFTAGLPSPIRAGQMQTRVGAGRKGAGNALVAIGASFVADKGGAFNLQRNHHRAIHCGARIHQHAQRHDGHGQREGCKPPHVLQFGQAH